MPIRTKTGIVSQDGTLRPDTSAEGLAGLKPAFDANGSVTAGTSSPLTDGASAVLVTSEDYAHANGLEILARIKSVGISGCAPEVMGLGPIGASTKALERAGIGVDDLDVVELNEAFASQALACMRDLGLRSETVNIDGGAIAIGHPLGATGARIVGKAAALLKRDGGHYALATQCIGGRPRHRHRAGGGRVTDAIRPAGVQPDSIKKVCVIGAGVMGAGIAAQVANAGIKVLLLDIVRDPANRNAMAEGAVAKMLKTDPAPFMSTRAAKLVETGNIEDDLGKVAECDWVIEAVIERLDIKHDLYAKLEAVRRPGTAISSNTSTIPLDTLIEGRSDVFKRDFLITHFFNPPRYMRLLEIVTGAATDAALAARVEDFADRSLGKTTVRAKDTPGFIANRIGAYWIQLGINTAFDLGLTVEEADAVAGRPMGMPKTGIFGLVDLVGIDLMPHLQKSLTGTLPKDDPYQLSARAHPLIDTMIEGGFTGRKGKGGFYRVNRELGKRKETIDLVTGKYRLPIKAGGLPADAAKGDLNALIGLEGKMGDYAWAVLGGTLAYAASLVPQAADTIAAVDDAMKLGYNWKFGPFELIDKIGAAKLATRLEAEGRAVPKLLKLAGDRSFYRVENGKRQYLGLDGDYHDIVRPEGVLRLEDIKLASAPLLRNASVALWDVGDGVACLEFTGKMNALDGEVMKLIGQAIPLVQKSFKALVVYNDASNFSAGANLGLALFALNIAAWSEVEKLVAGGQKPIRRSNMHPFLWSARRPEWRSAAGARSCFTAMQSRRMPSFTWVWSNAASD